MKIKILTFHFAKNYGAALQAYALLYFLKKYTKKVAIINYRPASIINTYYSKINTKSAFAFATSVIRYVIYIIRFCFFGLGNRKRKFKLFEKEFLDVTDDEIYTDISEVSAGDADFLFLGSDQIWNPRITGYDKVYLGVVKKSPSCKVVSYAASIGNDTPTEYEIAFVARYIQEMFRVSVREEAARNALSKYRRDIAILLDPTLLLSQDEWSRISVYSKDRDYVLLYNMVSSETGNLIAQRIANALNVGIVEIFPGSRSLRKIYRHKVYPSAGPREFVGLFAHAQYVVTSSFHGTAFSLIFNKQFVTVAHPTAGSRMRDLLARIGLSNRIVSSVDDLPEGDIDYSVVNARLDAERRKSLDFIESVLDVYRIENANPVAD